MNILCAVAFATLAAGVSQDPQAVSQGRRATSEAGPESREELNIRQVMRLYEEAYHQDDYAVADEIFAPDYVRHDASDPVQESGEAVLQSERTREVKTLIPDGRYVSYDVVMADSDFVAVRWTVRGTPVGAPALFRRLVGKGGPIEMTGVNMYRFRDGRVVELWINRDDLTMMREMGMFRLFGAGGFLAGMLVAGTLVLVVRRWRSRRQRNPATAAERTESPLSVTRG